MKIHHLTTTELLKLQLAIVKELSDRGVAISEDINSSFESQVCSVLDKNINKKDLK